MTIRRPFLLAAVLVCATAAVLAFPGAGSADTGAGAAQPIPILASRGPTPFSGCTADRPQPGPASSTKSEGCPCPVVRDGHDDRVVGRIMRRWCASAPLRSVSPGSGCGTHSAIPTLRVAGNGPGKDQGRA